MSKLRKMRIFSYILPVCVSVFLFSVVGTVIADNLYNVYIGGIDTVLNLGSGNTTAYETITLKLYNSSSLIGNPTWNKVIYNGGQYGSANGLIATAFSAQAHRTGVNIITSGIGGPRITSISQVGNPDDIAGQVTGVQEAVDQVQDTVDGVYSQVMGQSGMLNGLANLTIGVDQHVGYVSTQVQDVDEHVGYVSAQVQDVDEHVGYVSAQVQDVDEHVGYVSNQVQDVDEHVGYVSNQVQDTDEHVGYVGNQVQDVDLHLNAQDEVLEDIWNAVNPNPPPPPPPVYEKKD